MNLRYSFWRKEIFWPCFYSFSIPFLFLQVRLPLAQDFCTITDLVDLPQTSPTRERNYLLVSIEVHFNRIWGVVGIVRARRWQTRASTATRTTSTISLKTSFNRLSSIKIAWSSSWRRTALTSATHSICRSAIILCRRREREICFLRDDLYV